MKGFSGVLDGTGKRIKDAAISMKEGFGFVLFVIMSFFEKMADTIQGQSFQAMFDLYCMRAVAVLALATSVAEHDTFDIIMCAVIVGVMLLPMENSFKENL